MRCGRYTTGTRNTGTRRPGSVRPRTSSTPSIHIRVRIPVRNTTKLHADTTPGSPEFRQFLAAMLRFGASSSAKIRFVDVMPFIATWKYEPSCRSGMKKSAASRIVSNTAAIGVKPSGSTPDSAKTPDGESEPDTNRHTATPMPAAAPPYATASIAVSERSWICSTFMVITRNCSAFSSMTRAARSSASKVFSVSSPCRLSRNDAPISVYLPQYFLNTRAARIATMPTMSTMSGAQASSVAAVGRSIGASTANSVMGASTA